jgi:hypothetical protein
MNGAEAEKEAVVGGWMKLTEEQRKQLIPILLYSISEWRIWSKTATSERHWLERQFQSAGVPFRESMRGSQL